jgi:hypothetical protein
MTLKYQKSLKMSKDLKISEQLKNFKISKKKSPKDLERPGKDLKTSFKISKRTKNKMI